MEYITENITTIIITAISAITAGTFAIRFISRKNKKNSVSQHNNFVGGDMAGRDIKK